MVQAAEPRHRDYPATWARNSNGLASCRGLLLQPEVRLVFVVVTYVLGHEPSKMSLVEHDHMIEQVSPAIADEALRHSVLPRTAETSSLGFDPETLDGGDDLCVEVGGAVEDQMLRSRAIRKSLTQLLYHPGACRMPGYIAVEDTPTITCRVR